MIVLAIAGLILAIVFIAVPALQRNSRDAQRKADISAIQGALATYVGNNNGDIPETIAEMGEVLTGVDLSFYNVTPEIASATPTDRAVLVDTRDDYIPVTTLDRPEDFVSYIEDAECLAALVGTPVVKTAEFTGDVANLVADGQARSYAIVYATESAPNWICIDNT